MHLTCQSPFDIEQCDFLKYRTYHFPRLIVIFKELMNQVNQSPPRLMKKGSNQSSPTLHKQKSYLPSRYGQEININKSGFHDILNSIEFNTKIADAEKNANHLSPSKTKPQERTTPNIRSRKEPSQFKPKPLKRQESDFQNFKEIFLDPRMQILDQIKQTSKSEQIVYAKQVCKQYEKLLQFQTGQTFTNKDKNDEISNQEVSVHFDQCIEILSNSDQNLSAPFENDFYQEQMRIEPPDMPNSSVASTLSPGAGYAPSIPISINTSNKKANLTELLMRAKAGMNTEDIEKEAHLSFYLGVVYEEKRQYQSALKFYRRFLGFAKAMEDKIGMALGANRVAINFYYIGDTSKSISFHNENLKLSDNENCFAAYYNLGICHRKIGKFQDSLEYFETALQWANQNGQPQSECITLGQIGVTYRNMELYQKSLENFEKSIDICRKLKKTKLQECNLLNILLITSKFNLKSQKMIEELSLQAYECSKILGEKKMQEIFSCNIGIVKGFEDFKLNKQISQFAPDIEYADADEEIKHQDENRNQNDKTEPLLSQFSKRDISSGRTEKLE